MATAQDLGDFKFSTMASGGPSVPILGGMFSFMIINQSKGIFLERLQWVNGGYLVITFSSTGCAYEGGLYGVLINEYV